MRFEKSFLLFLVTTLISCCSWKLTEQRQDRDCIHKCGNISVPYPFGIGPKHCYSDPYFEVSCIKSSSSSQIKPFLKILHYEIISTPDFSDRAGSVIVQIPSVTVCSSNSSRANKSQNLAKSSLKFSKSENVFVSVGCEGYALLYNEAGRIIAGCTSHCSPNPPADVLSPWGCYGYHCCQAKLALETQEYGVRVILNNNTSGNCRSAFLISQQYLMDNAATLAPGTTAVHVVLEWGSHYGYSNLWQKVVLIFILLPGGMFGFFETTFAYVTQNWACNTPLQSLFKGA